MQKVIVVNYTGRNGAGPINAYEMTKAMIDNGKSVIAIISDSCSNLELWKNLDLCELILLETYKSSFSLLVRSIQMLFLNNKEIKYLKLKYKIEYIYCPMVCMWSEIINYKIGKDIKVCVVNHDPIPHMGDRSTWLANLFGMQRVYKHAAIIVVHSKIFIKYVEKKYKHENRVLYIPLGRHNCYLSHEKCAPYSKYDTNKINFLFFGRIEEYKGIDILLSAYADVIKKCNNVSLTIVGNGKCDIYKEKMYALGVNLENRWIKDEEVGSFFCGPNVVLVLPYKEATQSGPVLIALEYHVPSICTRTGGLAEQVDEGKTGLLIPPNDAKQLSCAMCFLAEDTANREKLVKGIDDKLKSLDWHNLAQVVDDAMFGCSIKSVF